MSIRRLTVLLAMNNPVSTHPLHALYPYPPRCTGARILEMLDSWARLNRGVEVDAPAYLTGFDRRNILNAPIWSMRAARIAGPRVWASQAGRRVVVFGASTLRAVGAPRPPWFDWARHAGVDYCLLPHPSGRCRVYNDPIVRDIVGGILYEEFAGGGTPK